MKNIFYVGLILLSLSCKKEDDVIINDEPMQEPAPLPTPQFTFVNEWTGSGGTGISLYSPKKLIATENFVFIDDEGNSRIKKFDLSGSYLDELPFSNPFYIFNDHLFVISSANAFELLKYDFNFTLISTYTFSTSLASVHDISGNDTVAIVSDKFSTQPYMKYIDISNLTVTSFGNEGSADLEFSSNGWFASKYFGGDFYLTDNGNYRVQTLSGSGLFESKFATNGSNSEMQNSPSVIDVNDDFIAVSNGNNAGDGIYFYDRATETFQNNLEMPGYMQQSISFKGDSIYVLVTYPSDAIRLYKKP